jgi:hypothetical protein
LEGRRRSGGREVEQDFVVQLKSAEREMTFCLRTFR